MITKLIEIVYSFLWGELIQIPLPGGSSVGISLLIILLIPMGIYFTVRTRFLPIRLFPDMVRALVGTKAKKDADGKSEKKGKERKGQLVHISDADRFNGNERRDGESGRSGCSNFRRWCRSCILDVGFCDSWNVYKIF